MKLAEFDLTNWREHPTNSQYRVFFFKTVEEGCYFETLLREYKIEYEMYREDDSKYKMYYGIHYNNLEKTKHLNNLVLGKFKKPFIPYRGFRIFLFVISLLVLTLAIAGYIASHQSP